MKTLVRVACTFCLIVSAAYADDASEESTRDILVTFENAGASATGSSFSAPYRNRKRYAISANARTNANAIADEYQLTEVDHWPIRSLSVYCYVYRVPPDQNRDEIVRKLRSDDRIESVQPLQQFQTGTSDSSNYNDKYVGLQHGLDQLGISAAHDFTRGEGVRIAVIDSNADTGHEDLSGRIKKRSVFTRKNQVRDESHGTAVTSVIGALANNKLGIVGVAPSAEIELLVSCWAEENESGAVCDTFTLAKALDQLLVKPPDILNLSLTGPDDPLLARLLNAVLEIGVIVVAADSGSDKAGDNFPAMLDGVIGVKSTGAFASRDSYDDARSVLAPGEKIMVALPNDKYDFRSGSSLAAAHVSGVIALLLAASPEQTSASVLSMLRESQKKNLADAKSVDACMVLNLAGGRPSCKRRPQVEIASKLESGS
ncbi:MAG: S8 family peptidase [Woeseiaceae bacterium]